MDSDDPPPPQVRVTLPDGQDVLGVLHERRQWPLSGWKYQVGLPAWANDSAKESVEPSEYRVWLTPGEQVHAVEGADYGQVPTYLLDRGDDQAADSGRWGWKVQRLRPSKGHPGTVVVHIWDCADAPAGDPELDVYEALDVLRSKAGAVACKECGAAAALHPLLEAP